MINFNERIRRALRMSSIGDALGDKFEFERNIDLQDVVDHIRSNSEIHITDDTQMTLFGFDAIQRFAMDTTIYHIQDGYLRWYHTQTNYDAHGGGLLGEQMMYVRRAPGLTCLSALKSAANFDPVVNESYGCGSVMRLLPFVWLLKKQPLDAMALAVQSGYITHKHKKNEKAIIDYMLVAKLAIDAGSLTMTEDLRVSEYITNLIKYNHISQIGTGWTAQECVDMAVWAAWTSDSFEECLVKSIAHDGDSDSVAAVACGLYALIDKSTHDYDGLYSRIKEKHIIDSICDKIV